ncbi:MAG TPA: Asp-tRNA(Asn)/Glu-tRNA(Gln) amidotransferase subunit GatB, partial [bacterium (Candidatus Stahlbacteria)]|nr:Asp-tRNA(Asn)/Glu-tRNA(Gln) amidotransferase subunit GatB [Candidatus Stahlbacteria bacterium]
MDYETKVGMEVHAQLLTRTKLFCSCPIRWDAEPNTLTCPVCLGMPGTLPVLNKRAVELAIRAALTLNCKVAEVSIFARKNYFYPDLPKGYQITQYERPLASDGFFDINDKRLKITRINLEEDAGKLIHLEGSTLVDFNRCGVPLIEIVTEPEIDSAKEAGLYLTKLRQILKYIGVCQGDMEKGHLRCDLNVSVRKVGTKKFGIRTEVKNLNSIKAVERVVEYEVKRQIKVLESGAKVEQVTMLWDEKEQRTREMRGKEMTEDYRYFPEPDLPPLVINRQWIEDIKKSIPELPKEKIERFVKTYGIREYDAEILTQERPLADYFEEVVALHRDSKLVASFMTQEMLKFINEKGISIDEFTLKPSELASLLELIKKGTITRKIAKEVFPQMVEEGKSAKEIVKERGLTPIEDRTELEKIIQEVLKEHPKEVEK